MTATAVMPGPVRTEFFTKAGVDMEEMPDAFLATPEEVVTAGLGAVRRGKVLVTPTVPAKVGMALMKFAPRSLTRRVMRAVPHM